MDLKEANYYSAESNREYMSVSQYKDFRACEAAALAKIKGEWDQPSTTARLVGSYVDAYFDGTLDAFREKHPEIFKRDGSLKIDYAKAEEVIAVIEADPEFMSYMDGETQVIRTAELFGTPWKIKIDVDRPDDIVDLKVMRSMERIMGRSFVEHWGYDTQLAVYAEVSRKAGAVRKNTYLAVATKQDPPDHNVIHVPEWRRKECLAEVERNMPRILKVKRGETEPIRCGVCAYCRSTQRVTQPLDFELVGLSASQIEAVTGGAQ